MKLLFVCNNMHVGGIQRALVNLVNEISNKHDVTLMLLYPEGEYLSQLNKNVKIKNGNRYTKILGMTQAEAKKDGIFTFLWRSMWVVLTRIFSSKFTYNALSRFEKIDEQYDVSISYMQNSKYRYFYGGMNEFVINSTTAKQKIAFIHCDYKNYIGNNSYNKDYYKNFDKIACVSESCKKVFVEECPKYENKTVVVPNCYNFLQMETLSKEFEVSKEKGILNILTCARISEEKGILRMIPIFSYFKNIGLKFIWKIAGEGPLMETAINEIKENGLSSEILFLGNLDNPYPYYKAADLILVPSYNEAAPMVFGEAEFFNTPILTTNTTSAVEMVLEKNVGFVCENNDDSLKEMLEKILRNPSALENKKSSIKNNNEEAVNAFEIILM